MKIRINRIDEIFSKCIRESHHWTCLHSRAMDPAGQMKGASAKMDCAHIYGRRSTATRWHVANAICLSKSSHLNFTQHPIMFTAWLDMELGKQHMAELRRRHNQTIIQYTAKDREDIYRHFVTEYADMRAMRLDGVVGKITLQPFD